jgi:SET domain-containing protein
MISGTLSAPKLALHAIGRKGRGVFAAGPIAPGELLEMAPTGELDRRDTDTILHTTLDDYYFAHPADPEGGLLVFGLSSLMNHAGRPNAETTARHARGIGWIVELRALRAIAPGEELTRRYSCEPWFEPEPPAGKSGGVTSPRHVRAGTNRPVEVRPAGRKGRGVFATGSIRAGELIEAAQTLELTAADTEALARISADQYLFAHPEGAGRGVLALGLMTIVNHATEPNARLAKRHEEGVGWIFELRARRDIAPGEELAIDYDCALWFDADPPFPVLR